MDICWYLWIVNLQSTASSIYVLSIECCKSSLCCFDIVKCNDCQGKSSVPVTKQNAKYTCFKNSYNNLLKVNRWICVLVQNIYIFPDGIYPKISNHSENSTKLYKFNCLVLENPQPLKISFSFLGGVGIFYGTAQHEEWEGTRNDNMMSTSGLGGLIL